MNEWLAQWLSARSSFVGSQVQIYVRSDVFGTIAV